jgi:ATP-dependent Lhr-like helicase
VGKAHPSGSDRTLLHRLIQTGYLLWFGCGNRRIAFTFADDLDLFTDRSGRKGSKPLAWQGSVTNDAFSTLRQGVLTNFTPFEPQRERRRPSQTTYNRWSATRPLADNWYPIAGDSMERDPVDEAELAKDRVRQVFRRYGLLFRELLAWELPSPNGPGHSRPSD